MKISTLVTISIITLSTSSAHAAVKAYDSSADNGTPGDFVTSTVNLCPPVQTSPGILFGNAILEDDGLGTVTVSSLNIEIESGLDIGPAQLVPVFGPGAFFFVELASTQSGASGHVSNTSGVGAHGPSGTAPGESAEWGVTSGWVMTGFSFCASSPVLICNNDPRFSHGATVPVLNPPSDTYDLGTWNFDSTGDYEIDTPFINGTGNGGLTNGRFALRGAFQGSSLPALPLVGFGALAVSVALIGARTLAGRK
jgi:hypothetical protein